MYIGRHAGDLPFSSKVLAAWKLSLMQAKNNGFLCESSWKDTSAPLATNKSVNSGNSLSSDAQCNKLRVIHVDTHTSMYMYM